MQSLTYILHCPLRFFNWQAAAIKQVDPQALVTVGAWSGRVNTDNFGFHNLYKDTCLVKAGGMPHVSVTYKCSCVW